MEHPSFLYCEDCKKIAAVIEGAPTLACCGDPMKALRANKSDGASEKHVPVVLRQGDALRVSVGDIFHPMTAEHGIGWVCLVTEEGWQLKKLPVGRDPVVSFALAQGDAPEAAYAWCNLHGLWKTDIQ